MLSCKFYGVSRTCVAQVARRGTLFRLKTNHEIRLISNDYVGLNVGGKIYETSRATMTRYPNSFFAALMESDVPSAKDNQGNYLIDRDGEIFRHVLNFLRTGELVLPETFNELSLLEREADFFLLRELKMLITQRLPTCEAMGVGLMFDNGKVFNTKRETLMREENSFFTKMLSGEIEVAKDPQGNYIMDRDGRLFHHIMSYLRDGGIFNALKPDELDSLETDAEYFKLEVLAAHIQSIRFMQQNAPLISFNSPVPPPLHVYINHPVVNQEDGIIQLPYPGVYFFAVAYTVNLIDKFSMKNFFPKWFAVNDYVRSGVMNLEEIKENKHIERHSIPYHQLRLNASCYRLALNCNYV